ncbi:MAG: TadE/TadG family type IV pilus assembly protein [Candidatus Dormibacteria bacterium]
MRGRGRHTDQGGQGLVEFGLVSLLLVPLCVGFFDVGRAVYTNNSLASAARQGARYASVNCAYQQPTAYTGASVTTWMKQQSWGIDPTLLQVTVSPSDGTSCTAPGIPVTVTLHYNYVPVTPGLSQMAGSGVNLTGAATILSQ